MSDAGTLDPCFTAGEARKITDRKRSERTGNPPLGEPDEEAIAWAKGRVRSYFKERVESSLKWGMESASLVIKIDGGANNLHSSALARELAAFLRALGYHAAYGTHVNQYADELEDDEFWPVVVNW